MEKEASLPKLERVTERNHLHLDLYQLDAAALRSRRQPLPSYHPLPLFPDTRIHFEDISTSRMRNANMQDDDGALNLHLPGLGLVDAECVKLIEGIGDLLDSREMRSRYRART
ncbi:hypothetical protein PAXRUDRAFT_16640 [Paxillus rubicundulus Ve08.2h10]|uniref:Uncharacterized protein n=1 Tax=Paxillus rubicundulus Ve08.2h10 TaxID=930991 RepID=A0A0D0C799_9AGAM|nr:hypothetical protein PAXRUDRAFT_16640 [Paxillus rubicundulus Ve08.2h10]